MRGRYTPLLCLGAVAVIVLGLATLAYAQTPALPDVSIAIGGEKPGQGSSLSSSIKLVLLFTALSFAPAMMLTMTSFTRIAIVLGMTRTAIGTQSAPPNMVITGLAMFLTFAIMSPVFTSSYEAGMKPYLDGSMSEDEALGKTLAPFRKFILANTRGKDVELFLQVTRTERPKDDKEIPIQVLIPAFVLSELNSAFQIGFLIALPFLVLDMVVSSVLTSMSMITLPPVVISMPLKLMLFVIVDGWHLIISSLVKTYSV